jgi:hypothetical protein
VNDEGIDPEAMVLIAIGGAEFCQVYQLFDI